MKRLTIDLADRSYDIFIGRDILGDIGKTLRELVGSNRVAVVTHPGINKLYGEKVVASLEASGFETLCIEVPEGEESKSLSQASKIFDRLVDFRCDRQTALVALGGGVIGDLTGFIAATFMRGIPFIQVPTTLLSQVDSSVGGKTAVNHPKGKNLIGAFYQPRAVLIDIETLKTLPPDEFRVGMAEVIKYGVIADKDFFDYIDRNAEAILNLDRGCLEHIIETSCAIKARVVERDERESRYRMVLNFGHTYGHAIEAVANYSGFKHGEAVAIGMVYAARLSRLTGRCGADVENKIRALLEKIGLPVEVRTMSANEITEAMALDKKVENKALKFILVKKIGEIEIVEDVPESDWIRVLDN